ncbi:LOB domain-containing protein 22-like [Abrus precatorius]|uniref:LOB domain-containing protein 22-like n=1 Tax=Abrus precatorius TaxID=3816 RepID=A0A8B8MKB2_ABRPR|nr:LOB domain-containing protein 22-like [Abrus precatorius]
MESHIPRVKDACAACRFQRRRCGTHCILSSYFPNDRQDQFINAHRLFGVGRITNMLKTLDPQNRDAAASAIIYESDMRAIDPVGGCHRVIQQLQSQIESTEAELHLVRQNLAFFKAQGSSGNIINAAPQPNLESMPQELQQQQHVSYNPSQEDINMWALLNSIPLSHLSLEDNQESVVDSWHDDQEPALDSMNEMNSDAGSHHQANQKEN